MDLEQLKDINKAPERGQMLVYTRQKVLFDSYNSLDEALDKVKNTLSHKDLLELHLFDSTKEYRAISTESSRFSDGKIEWVADFPEDEHVNVYEENVKLENGMGVIIVLNHIAYDEQTGSAYMDDYRLKMGGC